MKKRADVLSWEDYFMGMAHLSAMRSKDPSTQVGAVIVDELNKVVSIGYNGLPHGCDDNEYPWQKEGGVYESKYAYVVHAELNAILNSPRPVRGCRLYVSLFPCNECAKAIIQAGIQEIIYEQDIYATTEAVLASKRMLKSAGVKLRQRTHTLHVTLNKASD